VEAPQTACFFDKNEVSKRPNILGVFSVKLVRKTYPKKETEKT